jgi:hypothetical protein
MKNTRMYISLNNSRSSDEDSCHGRNEYGKERNVLNKHRVCVSDRLLEGPSIAADHKSSSGLDVALTEHHAMKAYWGSGRILFFDVGTRWR